MVFPQKNASTDSGPAPRSLSTDAFRAPLLRAHVSASAGGPRCQWGGASTFCFRLNRPSCRLTEWGPCCSRQPPLWKTAKTGCSWETLGKFLRKNGAHPKKQGRAGASTIISSFHRNPFLGFFFFFFKEDFKQKTFGPFFKVFIEFVTILFLFHVLAFWFQGMWAFSSLTRDRTYIPCMGREVSSPGQPGKSSIYP